MPRRPWREEAIDNWQGTPDPAPLQVELGALRAVVEAFDRLDVDGRRRVLAYLADRYGARGDSP